MALAAMTLVAMATHIAAGNRIRGGAVPGATWQSPMRLGSEAENDTASKRDSYPVISDCIC